MAKKRAGVVADLEVFELRLAGEEFVVLSLPAGTSGAITPGLSVAEREVAEDAISGLSNAEIAKKRGRALRTVANQLASIYRKLGVSSRAELTARLYGRRRGK